ncbi:MAG: bifunctional riboflavin kinase/FAD synthetase [Anaerolineae bacterium]|nr:bifunctional riboflavin kinase/FAD synthetase [Chloroflexota bacterium]MBP6298343.1 bifunctional riboflavin kinase/FAD synthetase [Anaerolineae bacterium]
MNHATSLHDVHLNQPALVTIGVFDGVHIGHQHLVRQLVERARVSGHLTVVLTFFPHPDAVLHDITGPYYLTTPEQRAEELTRLGVDWVITQTFDDQFRHMRAADYIETLCQHVAMRELWVGQHFALGYDREGDIEFLRQEGARHGYTVHEVELVQGEDHSAVSSTRIRQLLQNGDVAEAGRLLGRLYTVEGEVVHGDQRGRTIGFPTANVQLWTEQVLPAFGVYTGFAAFNGETHPCVTNLGVRPTFDGKQLRVESHLLAFSGDIYGRTLKVSFMHRLRGEMRFPSIQDLIAQIAVDVEQARVLLDANR